MEEEALRIEEEIKSLLMEEEKAPQDAGALALDALVQSAKRQEELFSKVCELLEGLNDKMERFGKAADKMENTLHLMNAKITEGESTQRQLGPRGALVQPPGRSIGDPRNQIPVQTSKSGLTPGRSVEEQRARQEALEKERVRLAEEERIQQEENRKRRAEDEARRKKEEEERKQEELRLEEEERKRKDVLEQKTRGLMSNLISGGGSVDLFPDEPKRTQGGMLFDD